MLLGRRRQINHVNPPVKQDVAMLYACIAHFISDRSGANLLIDLPILFRTFCVLCGYRCLIGVYRRLKRPWVVIRES